MKIENSKQYEMEKYIYNGEVSNLGTVDGVDAKSILKGYRYDEELDMWFSKKANIAYTVKEVE